MARIRAVTKETFDRMEFDVGVVAVNLDISEAKTAQDIRTAYESSEKKNRLGVTRGGIGFVVSTEWREVEFDDNPGPFVGSSEKGASTVTLTMTILETTPENTKLAMGTADVLDVSGVSVVQERDYINILEDYVKLMHVITRQGKDAITVLEVDNVISIGGYNETKNDQGQTEIALTLQATRGTMEDTSLPYRKMFFPAAPATAPEIPA